jgi:hypothetical protein
MTKPFHDTTLDFWREKALLTFALLAPPVAWLAALSAVYGLHDLACRQGWAGDRFLGVQLGHWLLVVVFGAAMGVVVAAVVAARRIRGTTAEATGNGTGLARAAIVQAYIIGVTNVWSLLIFLVIEPCQ